jgi:hypothetical protein
MILPPLVFHGYSFAVGLSLAEKMPPTNTLAYSVPPSVRKIKGFVRFSPGRRSFW